MNNSAGGAQLYPDIGVASMLRNQWEAEVNFEIEAVNDREPVSEADDLVVIAAPDPQSEDFLGFLA